MIQRTLLAGLTGLLMLTPLAAKADTVNDEKAVKMANVAGCFTCHSLKHKDLKNGAIPVGPAWEDVALQYKDKPGAADFLTRIVLEGSNPYASHWKNKAAGIAMPPNAVAISEGDTRQLVFWILNH